MNIVTNRSAKSDTIKVSNKPIPPMNKATVGVLPVKMLNNIDPQRTPVVDYTKKVK